MTERGRRPGLSLRHRALLWMTLGLTVIGLAAAAIAYGIDMSDADRLLDEELRLIAFYAGPDLPVRPPRGRVHDGEILVQVRDGAGALLYSSNPAFAIPTPAAPGFGDVVVAGQRWRSYLDARADTTVQVSQRANPRQRLARTAALEASLPILVTIPLGWLVVWWGIGQMLTSLARLAGAIAARGVESQTPIDLEGVPAEVSTLVAAMNALIGRWRLILDQQKQFLSDAAH